MMNKEKKEIDHITGIETTGHEWDGLKELNNPLPRWWLWIFIATCVWSVGYWIVFPAWPTFGDNSERGGTKGILNWTQYKELAEQQEIINNIQNENLLIFKSKDFQEIINDPKIYAFALAGGKAAFKNNCSTCHGSGAEGKIGYPNLNDDDWIWGGSLQNIYETIKYGIRTEHEDSYRVTEMPSFSNDLNKKQINEIAQFIYQLSIKEIFSKEGSSLYNDYCSGCHQTNAKGNQEIGAPNLIDSIWLHSDGEIEAIKSQIMNPTNAVMPSWDQRLSEDTIRQLALYVHSLGGGE